MKRLKDVLNEQEDNYLMPFFWQHGASEETLREYMEVIYNSGIRAVCVEARPHPDFVGDGWWHDLDIIMDEARKRKMQVWVLDDAHFPTGYANGAAIHAPEHLKRWNLVERVIQVDGPTQGCKFEVASHLGYSFTDKGLFQFSEYKKEELIAVIVGKRIEGEETYYTDFVDITEKVNEDGWVYYDVPEGPHALFVYTKKLGAAATLNNYISFLEKDSVRLLIDAVYEPHYCHYQADFGETFAGFFSDEPGFYNLADAMYGVGEMGQIMPLPWTDDVKAQLYEKTGLGAGVLPALFHSLDGAERKVRCTYMDIITKKYQENFPDQVGQWCEERGVEYIGHVWEDGTGNRNLGAGIGHYFRALHGQHMSGIDAVINDLLPDRDYGNGFFYHYELPALAASAAHQNSWMKGRAMCEIFGAYGWSEGLTLMKWLADHMMVNGINYFVPHAFSDMAFPDPDNPPHFYANGMDPQFRYMHILFHYMNRICHLLNNGRAKVDVAVFFPAEGGWMGNAATYGRLGSLCLQNQISYEIVCADHLEQAEIVNEKIRVGQSEYKFLFIDNIEYLPTKTLERLRDLKLQGAQIYFVENAPINYEGELVSEIPVIQKADVLQLVDASRNCRLDIPSKWLRCYQYQQADYTVYMFFNSSMTSKVERTLSIPFERKDMPDFLIEYDALENRLIYPKFKEDGSVSLTLEGGETKIYFASTNPLFMENLITKEIDLRDIIWEKYKKPFVISLANYDSQDNFYELLELDKLQDIAKYKKDFAGRIRYESSFEGRYQKVMLENCYDGIELFVNNQSAGIKIAPPYCFDIDKFTVDGQNLLRIETATTLTNVVQDGFSMDRPVKPLGILGDVLLGKISNVD